jgi:hypothetical protein
LSNRFGMAGPALALAAMVLGAVASCQAAETSMTEARRADLDSFRRSFLAQDRSYPDAARAEAEGRLQQLEQSIASISQAYFELELARIVALADNGHTQSFPGPRSRRYDRVPVRLVPFGEDFYVLRASEQQASLLGGRLEAIDGHPVAALREAARSLAGGVPSFRDRNAGYFLESPEQMQALGMIKAGDAAEYRFSMPDGTLITRRLAAEPPDSARPRANADRWLYPEDMAAEPVGWRTLLAPDRAPWALQEPDAPFRMREAPDLSALVIELRQNNDGRGASIGEFLKQATQRVKSLAPRNLVLDMRMNGGGDLNTTRDFVQSLPALVPGRIFVLTSPWTFSAAISTVGYLKQAAPERVTIVGEAVGDRMNFFAEGTVVELPQSGAVLLFATQRHDYQTGCRAFPDCHRAVVRHPITLPTLAPEISAPWTIDAYKAGRDPGMEAIGPALRASNWPRPISRGT